MVFDPRLPWRNLFGWFANPSLIFIPKVDNNAMANMIKNNVDLSNFIIYNELEKIEKYFNNKSLHISYMPAQIMEELETVFISLLIVGGD
tara:strand:+ start:1298 stop:1567 length:270 start_codon:yes stop_codon:yes gene_type:complete